MTLLTTMKGSIMKIELTAEHISQLIRAIRTPWGALTVIALGGARKSERLNLSPCFIPAIEIFIVKPESRVKAVSPDVVAQSCKACAT